MKDFVTTLSQYALRVLGIELIVVVIVGALLMVLEGSLNSFGDGMFWAGLVVLVIGLLSVIGYGGVARSGSYPVGQTVGELNIPDRTNADLKEEHKSFSFLMLSLGVGVLAVVISQLI